MVWIVGLQIEPLVLVEGKWELPLNLQTTNPKLVEGLIPHSFQPSFFSNTQPFLRVFGGFLEIRILGKTGWKLPLEVWKSPIVWVQLRDKLGAAPSKDQL